jgi:hypothetical protein
MGALSATDGNSLLMGMMSIPGASVPFPSPKALALPDISGLRLCRFFSEAEPPECISNAEYWHERATSSVPVFQPHQPG